VTGASRGAGAAVTADAGEAADAVAGFGASDAPHSPQNLLAAGFSDPHAGHSAGKRAPHSPQNLLDAGLSA